MGIGPPNEGLYDIIVRNLITLKMPGKVSAYAAFAFDVLNSKLTGAVPHSLGDFKAVVNDSSAGDEQPSPLFVTWNTLHGSEVDLRGCIGTFEKQPLEKGLRTYAIVAALQDTRFKPITAKELPHLECGVTILRDFEPANDAYDWELGTHGIRISFVERGRNLGATFLPDVAVEQGWDKETTLQYLIRKAGSHADSYEGIIDSLKLTRYKGIKSAVSYQQYKHIAEELDKEG